MVSACAAPQPAVVVPVAMQAAPEVDLYAQARLFIATVSAVEPVAERECRALAPRADCDFRILVDDRPGMPANAFQTVDDQGRPVIAFTLAMIAEVRHADELAFVMAHEASHHILGHLDSQTRNATIGAAVMGEIASVMGGGSAEAILSAQQLGAEVGARTYSQEYELQADRLGTVIAFDAGFDPLVGAGFFARIPDPGNRFLGTHPPNAARIAVVRQTMAQLLAGT
jgi:predicted Zn-dependent protease